MKLRQGNIFTGICQSFCSQGEDVCLSACWDTPKEAHPPVGSTPPFGKHTSLGSTPPSGKHIPLEAHTPPGSTPPRSTPPPPGSTPGKHTPHPPLRRSLQRTVRILLECFLVVRIFPPLLFRCCASGLCFRFDCCNIIRLSYNYVALFLRVTKIRIKNTHNYSH